MKTLAELEAIRLKTLDKVNLRREKTCKRIVVGMGTCGIAAGAKAVLAACMNEVAKRDMLDVIVAQNGCIGMCEMEPIVEVMVPGQETVTYGKVTPEIAARIVAEHVAEGKPVAEYIIAK